MLTTLFLAARDSDRVGLVPAGAARSSFNNLRGSFNTLESKLATTPAEPAAIDFAGYSSTLKSSFSSKVPAMQAEFSKLSIPFPADTVSSTIDANEKTTLAEVATLIAASEARVIQLTKELASLEAETDISEITTSEFLADKPELKAQYEKEIAEGNYV